MSIGYAKLCSSVHNHNQSLIHRGSGWTSQRAKEFILKLKATEKMRLKKMLLKKSAPEDDVIRIKVIRSKIIRSISS